MHGHEGRAIAATNVLLAGLWLSSILWVARTALPDNPLRSGINARRELFSVLPEGWGFFTRNPREPVDMAYRLNEGGTELLSPPNSSARFLFGVTREARMITYEVDILLQGVKAEDWVTASSPDETLEALLGRAASSHALARRNPFKHHRLCGSILVANFDRVPWAWAAKASRLYTPNKAVALDVDCGTNPLPSPENPR